MPSGERLGAQLFSADGLLPGEWNVAGEHSGHRTDVPDAEIARTHANACFQRFAQQTVRHPLAATDERAWVDCFESGEEDVFLGAPGQLGRGGVIAQSIVTGARRALSSVD